MLMWKGGKFEKLKKVHRFDFWWPRGGEERTVKGSGDPAIAALLGSLPGGVGVLEHDGGHGARARPAAAGHGHVQWHC